MSAIKRLISEIQKTISKDPLNFWYKNNGIVIVCENFELDGKEVHLTNFSIVNGGQTTTMIGIADIPDDDFYMQCKIVKMKGNSQSDRDTFIQNIAEATNSQKPIKESDLRANTSEQNNLAERLKNEGVYYITKRGDKVPKQYSELYQAATIEQVGKISLAGILQMPGSARSSSAKMYNNEYYYQIFDSNAKEGVLADSLRIAYYYDLFVKTGLLGKGYDEATTLPMLKNGKTYQIACITLLAKIVKGVFTYETMISEFNNIDALKNIIKSMLGMDRIIIQKLDNEKDLFFQIFSIIGQEVLGYCYFNANEKAGADQKTLAASDYVKSDYNYYKDIIKRLWSIYNQNQILKSNIKSIML